MWTQTTPILGHQVLTLVAEAGGRCTIDALRAAAAERFGATAVFGNCHGQVFSFDELLEFFFAAGKLSRAGDGISLGQVPACSGH